MRKSDTCPKCGRDKDVRARQCKACRKVEQQSTKVQTRKNRYNSCVCGNKKLKHANKCRACANADLRVDGLYECACGNKKSPKSKTCRTCYLTSVDPVNDDGTIYCKYCDNLLPFEEFYSHASSWPGARSRCKTCWQKDGQFRARRDKCLKYGLTESRAVEIAALKNADCAICGDTVQKFHIDHCHTTGKFRDLLCSNCNSGLDLLRDDPDILRKAALYVEEHFK